VTSAARILAFARRAVEHAVREGRPDPDPPAELTGPGGLFVTLKTRDGSLRGCIGHLVSGGPLGRTIADVAFAAALKDPRFPPVRPEELPGLRIEVSLLGPFVPTRDPLRDLRVGVHGLRIRHAGRAGILLPQVAPEHGLDGPAFLEAVCAKAGLPAGAWRDAEVELFTAEVIEETPPGT
jgi:AmmeMemoRadiSam system protein A